MVAWQDVANYLQKTFENEATMATIADILLVILNVIWWIVVIHIVMSILIQFNVLNVRQPFVGQIWDGLNRLLQPLYNKIRRYLPDSGALDLAPLVVFIVIIVLRIIIVRNFYGPAFG
jgi:YggT family protein